jgi:hypothetical protein
VKHREDGSDVLCARSEKIVQQEQNDILEFRKWEDVV